MNRHEQETIINFNKLEKVAYIFTYEQTWQTHLEKKLGLKPTMKNGFGGRGYEIEKSRIKMPRAKKNLTTKQRKAIGERLSKIKSKPRKQRSSV